MGFQNLLQQSDYSLVLPNENLMPLGLILQKDKNFFQWFKPDEGSATNAFLKDLFQKKGRGITYPKVKESNLPTELVGSDIVNGGGHFVGGLLSKFSGRGGFTKSKTVLFSFKNAKKHVVNQIVLDEYLQFATLNEYAPTFAEAVKEDKMYIVTEALTSAELILRNADDFDINGSINAQTIDEYAKLKAGASYTDSEVYRINNEGDVPLVFAIKTAKIIYEKDKYRIKPASIIVRKGDEDDNVEYLNEGAELIFD